MLLVASKSTISIPVASILRTIHIIFAVQPDLTFLDVSFFYQVELRKDV